MRFQPTWIPHFFLCAIFIFKVQWAVSMLAEDFKHLHTGKDYISPEVIKEFVKMSNKSPDDHPTRAVKQVNNAWSKLSKVLRHPLRLMQHCLRREKYYASLDQRSQVVQDFRGVENNFVLLEATLVVFNLPELHDVEFSTSTLLLRMRALVLCDYKSAGKSSNEADIDLTQFFEDRSKTQLKISEKEFLRREILSDLRKMFTITLSWSASMPPIVYDHLSKSFLLTVYLFMEYNLAKDEELIKYLPQVSFSQIARRYYNIDRCLQSQKEQKEAKKKRPKGSGSKNPEQDPLGQVEFPKFTEAWTQIKNLVINPQATSNQDSMQDTSSLEEVFKNLNGNIFN